jgi:HSP20 family protein
MYSQSECYKSARAAPELTYRPLKKLTYLFGLALIKVDLPEIKREEIKVTVENGVLVLSGERELEKEEKGRKYHRIERAYGSFGRTFSLPDNADAEKVNAEFNDGVLKLHIAKREAARPKQIEVKIS